VTRDVNSVAAPSPPQRSHPPEFRGGTPLLRSIHEQRLLRHRLQSLDYAHVLKNAGVGYGDYIEQITYLLFLKLADEMTELGFATRSPPRLRGPS